MKQTYSLGETARCKQFKGYLGQEEMENSESHYNTKIGQFYVSGYTDNTVDSNGNPIFLKNVGDKVTLWFDLKENIDAIKNNKDITVTADSSGCATIGQKGCTRRKPTRDLRICMFRMNDSRKTMTKLHQGVRNFFKRQFIFTVYK